LHFFRPWLALASVWYSGNASAQLKVLPGSAARGEQLLVEKGCAKCHSLDGHGGNGAPDLTWTPPHAGAPGLLASAMWNHAPLMGEQKAELTSAEAADLFAYMYSALYFAPAGDVDERLRMRPGAMPTFRKLFDLPIYGAIAFAKQAEIELNARTKFSVRIVELECARAFEEERLSGMVFV